MHTPKIESIGHTVILAASLCPAVTLPVLALRLYGSHRILKRWHWDDTFIIIATVFAIMNSVVNSLQTRNGLGNHIADVPHSSVGNYFLLSAVGTATSYNLSTLFIKASVLFYYLRFASSPAFRYTTYCVLFVAVGYSLAGALAFAYSCVPMAKYWDSSIDGECVNVSASLLARCVLNVATDVCILLLPIWILWPLRLRSTMRKAGISLVLMAGGFVCAASIIRLVAMFTEEGSGEGDFTWHYVNNAVWCLIEMYAGIFCACLPCLKCVIVHHFPGLSSSSQGNNNRLRARSLPSLVWISLTADHPDHGEPTGARFKFWRRTPQMQKKPSRGNSDLDAGSGD
ncbi:hypothetical protein MFIFM68171_05625 [Madurella fahalii]|uniref:Rhodopsin domain-containing protein n=1 Tax=Madurella fahalii TaxID=1157608 RepID=A0ABQ0GCK9_9PEZI